MSLRPPSTPAPARVNAPFVPSKAVLFDLDGTLIDHFTTIYRCYRHVQETLGLKADTYEKVRATVGGSVPVTMRRLLGDHFTDEAVKLFQEHFAEIYLEDLEALPGSHAILKKLHAGGHVLAVFTNKNGYYSRKICDHLGFGSYLKHVFGTQDTPWRKPEVEFTTHVLETLGVLPDEAVMVGDSPFDLHAAQSRGIPCHLVATGSHSLEELSLLVPPADGVWNDLLHLMDHAEGSQR